VILHDLGQFRAAIQEYSILLRAKPDHVVWYLRELVPFFFFSFVFCEAIVGNFDDAKKIYSAVFVVRLDWIALRCHRSSGLSLVVLTFHLMVGIDLILHTCKVLRSFGMWGLTSLCLHNS
jgi:hypothetical protein